MTSLKKVYTLICLLSVFFSFFPLATNAVTANFESTTDEALALLEEVLLIDLSKYDVTLRSHSFDNIAPPLMPKLVVEENVKYELTSEGSNVSAIFIFKNGTMAWCRISTIDGLSIHKDQQQLTNDLDTAKGVLERYQNTLGLSGFYAMRDILNTVDTLESTLKTYGNLKLEVTKQSDATSFDWFYMYAGVDTEAFSIQIQNGDVRYITNYLCLSTVGSADVKIFEDQAINLAKEYLVSFSWNATDGSGNQVEVKDFNVLDSPVNAELSMQPRESMELYPYWYIELCLDKVYPGSVSSIHVGLWADTSTIVYCQPISAGVAYPAETETNNDLIDTSLVAVIPVVLIAVIVVAFFVKKRCK
jgi:hypothetical protein